MRARTRTAPGRKQGVSRVVGGRELFVKGAKCGRSDRSVKCGTKSEQMISEELILRWKELIQN